MRIVLNKYCVIRDNSYIEVYLNLGYVVYIYRKEIVAEEEYDTLYFFRKINGELFISNAIIVNEYNGEVGPAELLALSGLEILVWEPSTTYTIEDIFNCCGKQVFDVVKE